MSSRVTFGDDCEVTGPATTSVKAIATRVTALSEGNVRYVYQSRSTPLQQWTLQFQNLTGAERVLLQAFYDGVALGPTNFFDYTHGDRSVLSARFIDTELSWTRNNANCWEVSVTLETGDVV